METTIMNIEQMVYIMHQNAHAAPHDFDDTMFFTLTERDAWLVRLMFHFNMQAPPCLEPEMHDLFTRLSECMEEQKPHWIGRDEDDDESEE